MKTPRFKQNKPASPSGRKAGHWKDFSLARPGLSGRKAGHSLAEYALPAMLVGLLVVGSAATLLNGGFAQTGAMSNYGGKAVMTTTNANGQRQTAMTTRSLGESPFLQSRTFTTEGGTVITLSNLPVSVIDNLEVAGGHGTVDRFSAAFKELAEQLLAAGEIDEAQANAIKALSNKGHALGQDLSGLEAVLSQCDGTARCMKEHYFAEQTLMDIEGRHGRLSNFRVGDIPESDWARFNATRVSDAVRQGATDLFQSPSRYDTEGTVVMGSSLQDFYAGYAAVNVSSLSPSVRSVLQYLAFNVVTTANSAANVIREYATQAEGVTTDFASKMEVARGRWYENTGLRGDMPSVLVHGNSGGICATGQGKDTGAQCQ